VAVIHEHAFSVLENSARANLCCLIGGVPSSKFQVPERRPFGQSDRLQSHGMVEVGSLVQMSQQNAKKIENNLRSSTVH
jgi:hypothetical protein